MNANKIVRPIAAIIAGEIALILFATIAQEVLFNGIGYFTSSLSELLLGGLATFVAAILAGMVARLITKELHRIVPVFISILITAETIYLILADKTGDPVWFDIIGGISLIIGVWLGFHYSYFIIAIKKLVAGKAVTTGLHNHKPGSFQ